MATLDDIKTLRNVKDISQDGILNIYIRRAKTVIATYLNIPTVAITKTDPYTKVTTTTQPIDIEATYPDAIVQFVLEVLNRQGDEGVKSSGISSVQATYELGISESVKALLPAPFATMVDTFINSDYYNDQNFDYDELY